LIKRFNFIVDVKLNKVNFIIPDNNKIAPIDWAENRTMPSPIHTIFKNKIENGSLSFIAFNLDFSWMQFHDFCHIRKPDKKTPIYLSLSALSRDFVVFWIFLITSTSIIFRTTHFHSVRAN
jgi:hypothetical protein